MSLPGIRMPSTLPPFLVAGHESQYGDPFAYSSNGTGDGRKRRQYTTVPAVVSVSMLLKRDQMATFRRWFKDTLRSGDRSFSARVKAQGAGMLWFSADFLSMYIATAMHLGRWRVDAQLMLTGDGQVDAPPTSAFAGEVVMRLLGAATITVPRVLRGEVVMRLLVSTRLRGEVVMLLEVGEQPATGRVTEDGDSRVTEDGDIRSTE